MALSCVCVFVRFCGIIASHFRCFTRAIQHGGAYANANAARWLAASLSSLACLLACQSELASRWSPPGGSCHRFAEACPRERWSKAFSRLAISGLASSHTTCGANRTEKKPVFKQTPRLCRQATKTPFPRCICCALLQGERGGGSDFLVLKSPATTTTKGKRGRQPSMAFAPGALPSCHSRRCAGSAAGRSRPLPPTTRPRRRTYSRSAQLRAPQNSHVASRQQSSLSLARS